VDYPVTPCPLLSPYVGEEVRSTDRGRKEDGKIFDPRNRGRFLLCRTRYLHTPADRRPHELRVDRSGRLLKVQSGDVFDTTGMYPAVRGLDEDRRTGRGVFTLALDGTLYAGCATTLGIGTRQLVEIRKAPGSATHTRYLPDVIEFCHHSTFVAGADVLCAGELATNREGAVTYLSNFSGHYQPGKESFLHFVALLAERGVDLSRVVAGVVHADGTLTRHPAADWLAARGEGVPSLPDG
jgi:hypothetical protein